MTTITDSLTQDVKDIKKLDSNKKYKLVALLLVLFVASYFVGTYISRNSSLPVATNQQQQQSVLVTQPVAKPTTTLELVTKSNTLTVGVAQTVSVVLSKVAVTAADISIKYDPQIVTVSKATNGTVFGKVIRNKVEVDRLIYSGSVTPDKKDSLTEGTLFTFTVTAKKAGSSVVQFDPQDTVTALNGENTLGSSLGINFTVN